MGQAKRKRIATAMHEASHVVVGLDCGRRLVRCSIVPEVAFGGYGMVLGSTEWEPIGDGTVNVSELVKIALAGKAAEERMYGNPGESVRSDLALIYALAWLITVGSEKFTPHARLIRLLTGFYCEHPHKVPPRAKRLADEMISDLLPEVRDILERRWRDVELIAGLLLKHGRITPEMIDEVLLLEAVEEEVPAEHYGPVVQTP
jgi:ATP-dependent Zn protease